jgi:NADPH:quinone reductase-like Zn-dependent oxidoreductase
MRAAVVERFGEPFVVKTLPRPHVTPGHVLVRIVASGVNPLDVKIHEGAAAHARIQLPAILGVEMAGIVEAAGDGVSEFAPGDEVFGMIGGVGILPGTLAEYALADARFLAKKPAALTMREAAAVPLAFITAYEGLVDRAHLRAEHSVLVHGGAGSVGSMSVQLARSIGATVYATASVRDHASIEAMGAVPIDYGLPPEDYVAAYTAGNGFDVVYDTVGGKVLDASFVAARRYGGHVVSCLGWGTHALAPLSFRSATYSGVFTLTPLLDGINRENHGTIMREAARLAAAGVLRPRIDSTVYTLDEAELAHEAIRSKTSSGRVIVSVRDNA